MKRNLYRIVSFLLALSTLPLASACGDTVDTSAADTSEAGVETSKFDDYGREIIAHGIPSDLDFGNTVVNCLVRDQADFSIDFGVELQNGDIVNDAVHNRIKKKLIHILKIIVKR